MKRILILCLFALAASVVTADRASAQSPLSYSFLPFGFYQPYGAFYSNTIRTPPYFATNPPVYYGARHARPYGLSPFASPPLVSAADNYESRLRSQFLQPQIPTPGPYPSCNPCVSYSASVNAPTKVGKIRSNPFVESSDLVAQN